jgi:alpha-galactosidase
VGGIYNTADSASDVTVNFSDLGLSGSAAVRDLAARSDLGNSSGSWTASNIPAHGSRLIKLSGATGGTTGGTGGTTPPTTTPPPTTPPANSGAIKGVQSGKCVDVNGGNTADGATVTLYTCNGQSNQTWASSGGTLRSLGKCLDITGGGTANNTYVELWSCNGGANQQWTVNSDGTIRNPASGRCLDAAGGGTGNGTRLIIWDCSGQSNQKWTYGS